MRKPGGWAACVRTRSLSKPPVAGGAAWPVARSSTCQPIREQSRRSLPVADTKQRRKTQTWDRQKFADRSVYQEPARGASNGDTRHHEREIKALTGKPHFPYKYRRVTSCHSTFCRVRPTAPLRNARPLAAATLRAVYSGGRKLIRINRRFFAATLRPDAGSRGPIQGRRDAITSKIRANCFHPEELPTPWRAARQRESTAAVAATGRRAGVPFAFYRHSMSRRVLWLAILLVLGERAGAIELGDARGAVVAQYGAPAAATLDGRRLGYKWSGWKLDIEFSGDLFVQRLIFAHDTGPLSTAESDQLLNEHGGRAAWQAAPDDRGGQAWVRTADGARASLDPAQRQMTFVSKEWLAANTPPPAPAESMPARSRSLRIGDGFFRPTPEPSKTPMPPWVVLLIVFFMAAGGITAVRLLIAGSRKALGRLPRTCTGQPAQFRTECNLLASAETESPPFVEALPPERTLDSLSPQQFELMIGEMYRRQGYSVEVCAGDGADGGIDVTLRRGDEVVLVQCKHWRVYKVGVSTVREMYGVLTSEGAARVILVTTGMFTADARQFAAGKPIELVDGAALKGAIEESKYSGHGDLLDVESWSGAFREAAIVTAPRCPYCRSAMVMRRGRTSGNPFWGCSTYPACTGKRNVRPELMLAAPGMRGVSSRPELPACERSGSVVKPAK